MLQEMLMGRRIEAAKDTVSTMELRTGENMIVEGRTPFAVATARASR